MPRPTPSRITTPGSLGRVASIAGLTLLLTACGYKGPLYMPPPPPAPAESLTTPPSGEIDALTGTPPGASAPEAGTEAEGIAPGSAAQ